MAMDLLVMMILELSLKCFKIIMVELINKKVNLMMTTAKTIAKMKTVAMKMKKEKRRRIKERRKSEIFTYILIYNKYFQF